MKTSLLIIMLFVGINLHAQSNIHEFGGNVGIGTTNPEQPLTVVMNGSENGTGIAIKAVNSGAAGSQPAYSF